MIEIIGLSSLSSAVIGAGVCYVWLKHSTEKHFGYMEQESRARAKAIELEATHLLEASKSKIKSKEHQNEQEFTKRLMELEERQREVLLKQRQIESEAKQLDILSASLNDRVQKLETLEQQKQDAIDATIQKMQNVAAMTKEEAKVYILERVEEQSRADMAAIVRRYEQQAKEEGRKKANYILAQATTRFAGEFAGERLINTITLPSDDHKGRIIGKEGRNIKAMEMILGVDIIIDETPGVIVVSSFNLYRRAIATEVIRLLVEDGRIHPARIEEIFEKVKADFDRKAYEEGENILIDLGVFPMPEELTRLLGQMKYRASYGQNALGHTLEVANLAKVLAANMGGDEKLAVRAGLLHDIGKALTQEHGGSHVDIGAELCRKYNEHPTVINAIYAHHGLEEPDSVESAAVCAADTLSAARPGARREVLESFTKRVKDIETIALVKPNVTGAYAINAGREIRVFVNAKKISDNEIVLLSKEIAKEIQDKVQFPGEIKVNVIRESRAEAFAK